MLYMSVTFSNHVLQMLGFLCVFPQMFQTCVDFHSFLCTMKINSQTQLWPQHHTVSVKDRTIQANFKRLIMNFYSVWKWMEVSGGKKAFILLKVRSMVRCTVKYTGLKQLICWVSCCLSVATEGRKLLIIQLGSLTAVQLPPSIGEVSHDFFGSRHISCMFLFSPGFGRMKRFET